MGVIQKIRDQRNNWIWAICVCLSAILSLHVCFNATLAAGILTSILPFCFLATYRNPTVSLYLLILYSFALVFFSRYILKDFIPAGTIYDITLFISFIIAWLVKGDTKKIEWSRILDAPLFILFIWMCYCFFSLIVPGNPGLAVWMLAVRVHLYMVFSIPLFVMLLDVKSLKTTIVLWGVFSMIMSLKGFTQQFIGLDAADLEFLDGNSFHIVGGKLRVFGFCCDAGQFGVQQAHAATIGGFMFMSAKNGKQRLFYMLMALTGLYGMFVSGTRGAIFVIFGAAMAYCFLVRKTKLMIMAITLAGGFYCFMSYTDIGSSVYSVQRMRTAFKPEKDPSYLARKMNQATLKAYLKTRPFGGGLGAMEHGPKGSLLAETPYDSGYVLTWGEQGIVGLTMYIGMLLWFLFKGTIAVWSKIKNEWLRNIMIAIISGIVGVGVANYGNPVMVLHPTSVLYFLSVAIIYAAPRIDKSLSLQDEKENEKQSSSTQVIQ